MGSRVIPRLITFDVTDTLLMTHLEQHYSRAAVSQGLPSLDGQRTARTFRASFKRLDREHPIYGRHTGLGWERWWRTIVHDVVKEQHTDVAPDKLNKIADSLIECYGTSRCWDKYPGASELLESLSRKRGLVLGVISNFDERLEAVLDSSGLRSHFAFVLTSYGFGEAKPSPAIFQEALRLSSKGLSKPIHPSEAIHVGDSLHHDYQGARSALWNGILVNHSGAPVDRELVDSDDIFDSLHELRAHFDKLLQHRQDDQKESNSTAENCSR